MTKVKRRFKTLTVFGTRPEAIKMAPLVHGLNDDPAIESRVCVTGQHREMLDSVLSLFELKPEYDLDIMQHGQSITDITVLILAKLEPILNAYRPDVVLVHGDTTTALAAALAAFYQQIPVAHVEAGLRTGNIDRPWPEEGNRALISRIARLHFAPTQGAVQNLLTENVAENHVVETGNTVIDALYWVVDKIANDPQLREGLNNQFPFLPSFGNESNEPLLLVTCHRRENHGQGIEQIAMALQQIALKYPKLKICLPLHLNPVVRQPFEQALQGIDNVFLIEPQSYLPFVYLMQQATFILTDSGGIQEEAPALGKPVLVMRDETERPEAVEAGTVLLCGAQTSNIVQGVSALLDDSATYETMCSAKNPYGDGHAVKRIIDALQERFSHPSGTPL